MVITLVGYRGSGKSSVAAPLAQRLGFRWIDADAVIERQARKTIREIFADEGEAGFRLRERNVLAELLKQDKLVLAAGGGAVLDPETRRLMQESGPVVWLKAAIETLESRITADPTTAARRPNLAGGGHEEIVRLLAQREPIYRQCATLSIATDGLSVDQIVEEILQRLPA
jgi:shikimate kinase